MQQFGVILEFEKIKNFPRNNSELLKIIWIVELISILGVSVNFIVVNYFTLHALSVVCTCFNSNDLSTDLAGLI